MKTAKDFFKSFFTTIIIFIFIFSAIFLVAKAYENTVYIAFGAQKTAIAFTEDGLRILDFEINN